MHRDTIQRLTDNYLELGGRQHTVRYNDHDFTLVVKARAAELSTNHQARSRIQLNMEANIRKQMLGMGHGQYLSVADIRALEHGRVEMNTVVNGTPYRAMITVSPDGEYYSENLKTKTGSLREMSAKIMDAIFMQNGVDNVYRSVQRNQHVAEHGLRSQPSRPGMRM